MDKLFLRISFKKSCKALSVTGGDSAPKKSDGGLPPLPLSAYRASIPCLSPRESRPSAARAERANHDQPLVHPG